MHGDADAGPNGQPSKKIKLVVKKKEDGSSCADGSPMQAPSGLPPAVPSGSSLAQAPRPRAIKLKVVAGVWLAGEIASDDWALCVIC